MEAVDTAFRGWTRSTKGRLPCALSRDVVVR